MAILNLWGVPFHPVVVVDLGKNLLFKSVLGHCDYMAHFVWGWAIKARFGSGSRYFHEKNLQNWTVYLKGPFYIINP